MDRLWAFLDLAHDFLDDACKQAIAVDPFLAPHKDSAVPDISFQTVPLFL